MPDSQDINRLPALPVFSLHPNIIGVLLLTSCCSNPDSSTRALLSTNLTHQPLNCIMQPEHLTKGRNLKARVKLWVAVRRPTSTSVDTPATVLADGPVSMASSSSLNANRRSASARSSLSGRPLSPDEPLSADRPLLVDRPPTPYPFYESTGPNDPHVASPPVPIFGHGANVHGSDTPAPNRILAPPCPCNNCHLGKQFPLHKKITTNPTLQTVHMAAHNMSSSTAPALSATPCLQPARATIMLR